MTQNITVDISAKHRCKVDVFRTDISEVETSTLSVKFYGTSLLATYEAEIGSLPNGIDVKFAKNNEYLYDFRGKETTLELVVNNQDDSLVGDFTIPIIYTATGKKESSVICQLNILNDEEEVIVEPVVPTESVVDPVQQLTEEISDMVISEPKTAIQNPTILENILDVVMDTVPPVSNETSTTVEEILEILIPPEMPPSVLPPEHPPVALPEVETLPEPRVQPDFELIPEVIPTLSPVIESVSIPISDVSPL